MAQKNRHNSSITKNSNGKFNIAGLCAVLAWILIWQVLAMVLDSEILLVTPLKVVRVLAGMLVTASTYRAAGFSLLRITLGFLCAVILGTLLGALSHRYGFLKEFLKVPVSVIKATPIASFIILVLIWIPSKNLSVFISFLIAFPIIYTNVCEGLDSMDRKLLEMAEVFRLPFSRRIRYIYIPEVIPFFRSALELSLGMCWKAGIAAEIIGLPRGSIGERLYQAKIYLETPELFAWTIIIIALSAAFTRLVLFLMNKGLDRLEGR